MKPNDVMRKKLERLWDQTSMKKLGLAHKLGWTQQKMSKAMSGGVRLVPENIQPICDYFGVKREWFTDGDPDSPIVFLGSTSQALDEDVLRRVISRMGVPRAIDVLIAYGAWPVPPPNVTISPLLPTRIEYAEPDPKAAEAAQHRAIREARTDAKAEARGEGARPGGTNGKTPRSGQN